MNFKFSKKTMCIFVLLMVFISLGTVSAMEVNSTDDIVDSPQNQLELENDDEKLSILNDENVLSSAETFNGTTFSELRTKVNSLNNGDVLDLTSNVTQDGNSEITISKSITVNGNGITIDANGKSRIFNINGGATVVLNNIIFTNGYHSAKGGAIFNENSKVIITASQFIKNSAGDDGGAIYNNGGTMNIDDTYFIANKAVGWDGGAIHSDGDVFTVKGSLFINNTANHYGGAIYVGNALSNSIINSTFINNSANNGGAIYFNGTINNVTINGSFKDNNAERAGGAIYVRGQSSNNTFSSAFDGNQARQASGGAVFFYSLSESNNFESVYRNNYALYGGAVFFYNKANDNKFNSEFISNVAKSCGGAIFFHNTTNNNSFAGDFINNSALGEVDETNGNGGAITFKDVSTNCIFECDFINNTAAKNGGGVNYRQTPHNITFNGNFINNTSPNGGGINFFESFENIIFNGEFIGNSATYGGAIAAVEGIIKDVSFKNNHAEKGGAVAFTGFGEIINCNFSNNNVNSYGGAIFMYNGSVSNCTFINNTAAGFGGAIDFEGTGNVTNCSFTQNVAQRSGGAVWINSGRIVNSNFTDNNAPNLGGAVYFHSDHIDYIINCNFNNNNADEGGAVYFREDSIGNVINCNFDSNNAKDGGAIKFDGISAVTNSKFINNKANEGSAISLTKNGNISDSSFLNNRAYTDVLDVVSNENNITIFFVGYNSFINAISSVNDIKFVNVAYWGANGITNTNTNPPIRSNKEAGQNITVKGILNGKSLDMAFITDEEGKVVITDVSDYLLVVRHEEDSYYTEAKKVVTNIEFNVNVTFKTEYNKTVNLTAESNIITDAVGGKFVLPNGTEINANYASNGTWWAVYTFDDYGEYNVSASFAEIGNVHVNNGIIGIYKSNSIISTVNVTLPYADSINFTVSTEGATGITAEMEGEDVDVYVVDNYTVVLIGLSVGNYTLTVTTIPDDDHNSVTNSIIVNVTKAPTEIIVEKNAVDLNVHDVLSLNDTLAPACGGVLTYASNNTDSVLVIGNTLVALSEGTATVTVSFAGNENYLAAKNKTITVNVTLKDASVSVANSTLDLKVGDEFNLNATSNPDMLNIQYVSSNESVARVSPYGIVTAVGKGTAIITLTVGNGATYVINSTTVTVKVNDMAKKTTEIDVDVSVDENNVTIAAEVDPMASGLVEFNINGSAVYLAVNNGKAVYTTNLPVGEYNVIVTYMGDSNFNTNNTSKDFAVAGHIKKNTTLIPEVAVDGYDVTVTVNVNENATGFIEFTLNNNTVYNKVNNGKAVFTTNLAPGTYNAIVTYMGDNDFNNATAPVEIVVDRAYVLNVNEEPLVMSYKDGSSWDVTLTEVNGNAAVGEIVKIGINGKVYSVRTDANGVAKLPINLLPGTYELNATYENAFVEGSVIVNKAVATLSAENLVMSYKDGSSWDVTLTDAKGNAVVGEIVKIGVLGKVYSVRTDADGVAKLPINLAPGTYELNATYGDSFVEGSVTVNKAVATLSAENLVMSYKDGSSWDVTLTDVNGNAVVGEIVKISINGKVYSVRTDADGVAKLPVNLAIGKYTVSAVVDGANYESEEISKEISVTDYEANLIANDINMTYKDGTSYDVQLVDLSGNSVKVANLVVKITINGKTYSLKTDEEGMVKLPINLKAGNYTVSAEYNGVKIENSIIVKNA